MIINWFSPLPPERSGIANFSRFLLPYLQEHCHVRLWTSQPSMETVSAEVVRYTPGRLSRKQEAMLETPHNNFYNFGNNKQHHADMLDLFLLYPGHSIVHDSSLRGLFLGHFDSRFSIPVLHQLIEQNQRGPSLSGVNRLNSRIKHFLDRDGAILLEDSIDRLSPKVWVHTKEAQKRFPKARKLNLMYPSPAFQEPADRRDGHHHITLFGSLNAFRPISHILESLARYRRKKSLVLHIIGHFLNDSAETSEDVIRRKVAKLKLTERVAIHGFVSEERLETLLLKMDLAINFRTRSHGEASFSQLQLWSYSIPSIVSDVGWFHDLPNEVVIKVPLGQESRYLHAAWDRLLDNDPDLKRQGESGKEYLRLHHSPRDYAAALLSNDREIE